MRTLIYAPIIHTEADLGSMAGSVRRQFLEALGADEWLRWQALIEAMWDGLRGKLLALPLSWERTRLYQDGLPICDKEAQIVHELAAKGSRNHRLLAELMARGGDLMGTEDPELLVREYRRIQKLVQAVQDRAPDSVVADLKSEGEVLLHERDTFIAGRIDTTLKDGETGILFLGLMHRVDELLDSTIDIRNLIHSLPFGADPWRKLRGQRNDGNRHDGN